MKALIMAAGYGTRLEPLTLAVPKPMVPIVNLPTMQHNLELLKKHGFREIIANVHYHPEQIENYFSDGLAFGVNLAYSFEEELLGTAGGVKRMAQIGRVRGTFLVLSSDALTSVNLGNLVSFHRQKKALATIALAKVPEVSQFGIVVQDADNRITGFQEKPEPAAALSDLANTGIYVFEPEILDLIPDGPYDFGRQLFPKLVEMKAPLFGYRMVECWNDVGSLEKYIQSNYDAMKGALTIRVPGEKVSSSTWLGERGEIDPTARFEGTVVIGDRCSIGRDVYIKDAVIGDKCVVEDGAAITGSVLWSDIVVQAGARISGSVIGNFCHVGAGVKIDSAVIANRCLVRSSATVPPGTRLAPDSIF